MLRRASTLRMFQEVLFSVCRLMSVVTTPVHAASNPVVPNDRKGRKRYETVASLLSFWIIFITRLRAGRSGIESQWVRDFPPVQTGPAVHPASCQMGTGSFPEVKCGRGVLLTTHAFLVPRSWKSRAIPLPTLWATPGLKRDHFTFTSFYHQTSVRHRTAFLAHRRKVYILGEVVFHSL